MLTTLGCPETPDQTNFRAPWAEPTVSAQGFLGSEIARVRHLSTEKFLGSGVRGHPAVVSIQAWFLAGQKPKSAQVPFSAFALGLST